MKQPLPQAESGAPLIAHVLFRLDVGGLENGVVNLINRMSPERYRHAIVALTEATEFRNRIQRPDVPVFTLHKREGKDLGLYWRLWRLFRSLRPDIVHTRNMATLEAVLPAMLAGISCRVHGEHGWDVLDPHGSSPKYRWLRRAFRPLVHSYIPLSCHIQSYLQEHIGVPATRITQIYNGVDGRRFHPAGEGREPIGSAGFAPPEAIVIGTVGRMQAIKDPLNLAQAFVQLVRSHSAGPRLRLVMVGDGPLRAQAQKLLKAGGCRKQAWLPGNRDDVAELLRGLDVFVLPSLAEGISNTILEAMACGLPVVATRVGGNPELILEGTTGMLVEPGNPADLAAGIAAYLDAPQRRIEHGRAARQWVERHFSLERMTEQYLDVYDRVMSGKGKAQAPRSPANSFPPLEKGGG